MTSIFSPNNIILNAKAGDKYEALLLLVIFLNKMVMSLKNTSRE